MKATLKIFLIVSFLIFPTNALHSQSTINVFEMMIASLKESGFTDELECGDFKETWGQSIDEIAVEIGRLNVLFYEETNDERREAQIREYLGDITLPVLDYVFLPHINAVSSMNHEYGSNRIAIHGGSVVLSYFISLAYSYDQYCQIYNLDNELRLSEFISSLLTITQNNWVCDQNSPEYRDLAIFMRTYDNLYKRTLYEKSVDAILYSLDDYFNTNFQLLLLYFYAHELSHIVFKHRTPSNNIVALENDIEADMSAALLIFTRVKGGWGVDSDNGKVKSTIEPLLRLFEFITELYPEQMGNRLYHFMRRYLFAETVFSNGFDKYNIEVDE